jgi:O-6-methylguanine DNA methyltransferase
MAPSQFSTRVLAVVRRIPPGRVATYGDVAAAAGRPRAARAVGNIMRTCGSGQAPCHRVIAAGGRLGGYGGNIGLKRALLAAEGIRVVGTAVRDFRVKRWQAYGEPAAPKRPFPTKVAKAEPATPKRPFPTKVAKAGKPKGREIR